MQMTKSSPNDTPEFQSEECRRLIKNHCAAWTKKYTGKSKKKKPASTKAWRSVASGSRKEETRHGTNNGLAICCACSRKEETRTSIGLVAAIEEESPFVE